MSPLNRREFVAAGVAAGAGLVIGFYLPHKGQSPKEFFSPNAYLRITPDNKVTIVVARSEMGQGSMTALPMMINEELQCDWSKVRVEYASPNRNIRENKVYGDMFSHGSLSVRASQKRMQQVGASAHERLIAALRAVGTCRHPNARPLPAW